MNLHDFRAYCLSFQGISEEMPFDNVTLVFKVMGKMFALTDLEMFENINLKCEPNKALELRENYDAVRAGYHMNKKHWNTITVNSDMTDREIYDLVKHSYELVFSALPKKMKEEANG